MKLEGPISGEPFSLFGIRELSARGYACEEWFVSGSASGYVATGESGARRAEGAEFKTRLLVCRPRDPARFSGSLLVEWFNVSGGLDACPDFLFLHRHLMREGAAWVGVSVQRAGIDGGGLVPGMPLKKARPARYASLVHPGDRYAFGIYSAIGRLLREPVAGPLEGLRPERVIGIGESQSAGYLVRYVNDVDPVERVFDGYLIHGRPGAAAALDGRYLRAAAGDDAADVSAARVASDRGDRVREDVRVPVLTLQSETDVVILGSGRARQPDHERFRLFELAGAAHFDTYGLVAAHVDREGIAVEELAEHLAPRNVVVGMRAEHPVNSGPQQHYVLNAAVHHLDRWIADGTPPPQAPRLESHDEQGTALVRDELGIVRGGIRTPWVDAPTALLCGDPPGGEGFLFLFGQTRPFDADTLRRLYPGGAAEHRRRFEAATDAALSAGFLLPEDAAEIRALGRHGRQPSGFRES